MLTIFGAVCLLVGVVFLLFNFVIYPKKYQSFVYRFSNEYNLERSLVYAVIKTESNFNASAVSRSGAMGLMQILPSTAKWIAGELEEEFNENQLFEPETNIKYGCFYLRYLMDKFLSIDAAICAYNAGEGAVRAWLDGEGNVEEEKITYSETKKYLKKVKNYIKVYSSDTIFV